MRINSLSSLFIAGLALMVFVAGGCEPDGGTATKPAADQHDDGHDHEGHGEDEHDHPPHGPFGGHVFDIDSPDHQVEWKKYKDNNIIRMYLLDGEGKKAVEEVVDSFVVTPQAGKDDVSFELAAENPNDSGASSTYMLEDEDLTIAIPLGVDVAIKIGDKTFKGQIKAHKPLDH